MIFIASLRSIYILDSMRGRKQPDTVKMLEQFLVNLAICSDKPVPGKFRTFYPKACQPSYPSGVEAEGPQQVPQQRNFVDCGIYVIHYATKFMQNPDKYCHLMNVGPISYFAFLVK